MEGGAWSSKDILSGIFATPLRMASNTFAIFFRPKDFYANTALGSRAGLNRAFGYFGLTVGTAVGALYLFRTWTGSFLKLDVQRDQVLRFMDAIQHNQILLQIFLGIVFTIIVMFWYLMLRRKSVRDKINFWKFLHCLLYPVGAAYLVTVLIGLIEAGVVYGLEYTVADQQTISACGIPIGHFCESVPVYQEYPALGWLRWLVQWSSYAILVWALWVIATVINFKTGIKRWWAMLSLLISPPVVLVILVGAIAVFFD
jgi:hypothetical protein